jgi:uncharacterized membrane protein
MTTIDLVLLIAASATCVGILIFGLAGGFFVHSRDVPQRSEIRRHMLCGLYCNPDDPRAIVHRPTGMGWTINVRREALAQLLIVMGAIAMISGVIYLLLQASPPAMPTFASP